MTDKQKEAILVLNRIKESLNDDEYFILLEFVVNNKTEIQDASQPRIPWIVSEPLRPYYDYGGTGDSLPPSPYKVTC